MLIGRGASVNDKDIKGSAPLHIVCWQGYAETCMMLIEQGVSLTDKGN